MLKETTKDVYKVYTETQTYYTDEPFEVVADRLQDDGGRFSISKKSAPFADWEKSSDHAARLDIVMYNDFSSGGGFHHAVCVHNDLIYCVDNDYPLVMTTYNGSDLSHLDETFTDENMVRSFDVNEGLSAMDRSIYEFLLAELSE